MEEPAEMYPTYILFFGELKCTLLAHSTYTSNFIYSHPFSKLVTFSDFGSHWPRIVNDTGYHEVGEMNKLQNFTDKLKLVKKYLHMEKSPKGSSSTSSGQPQMVFISLLMLFFIFF